MPLAETATSTLDEFKQKYPAYNPVQPLIEREGIFPYYRHNSICKLSEPLAGWLWKAYKTDRLSSLNFDYDTTDECEREEHKLPWEAPVTIAVATISHAYAHMTVIIGSMRNLNTFVILNGVEIAEEASECPIILCLEADSTFHRAGLQTNSETDGIVPIIPPLNFPYSSLFPSDLFENFWKKYDELLRVSFHPITYNATLPAYLLHTFTFDRLKIINGQPLIPVSLKYKVTDGGMIDVEMLFKTVKKYE